MELDDLGRLRVFLGQLGQCFIEREEVVRFDANRHRVMIEVDPPPAAAVLDARLPPGVLNQDPAHGLGHRGKEVPLAVPGRFFRAVVLGGDTSRRYAWWTRAVGWSPDASRVPSGLQTTASTKSLWPRKVESFPPVSASHTQISLSPAADASRLPSGLQDTPMII